MPATERLYDRGTSLGERRLRELGAEFRSKRLELGLTQVEVAKAARISRSTYSRLESGKCRSASVLNCARVGAVLGLDFSAKTFPGGESLRDAGQVSKIEKLRSEIGAPLRTRTEALLPRRSSWPERRRWDLIATGHGRRTVFEFEQRLYDAQDQEGRWNLKRRDDPADSFVLVLADTRGNRETLRKHPQLFADLKRLRKAIVLERLRNGEHPPTGLMLY